MTTTRRHIAAALLCVSVLSTCCGASSDGGREARPVSYAEPLQKPGLDNLHLVAPGIYRGAQPEVEGFASLEALGVKTIVNLREGGSDRDEMDAAGLKDAFRIVEIPMRASGVGEEEIVAFLRVATDEAMLPLFFHCRHGSDRTGAMAAAYRVVVEGWTKEAAVDEMVNGGFGFHGVFSNLVRTIEGLNVEKVKREIAPVP